MNADRAADDPVKLARAVRIVRAALARRLLTVADLLGESGPRPYTFGGGGRG